MIYVGIDIAKETHYAAVLDEQHTVLIEPFVFQNDFAGFSLLLKKLSAFSQKDVLIGMESTAHYGENLIAWLFDAGYNLCVFNPIQTATLRKTNIRKTKNDKVDSLLIAQALIVLPHRLYNKADVDSLKLKTLCRYLQNLKKSIARLKIQLVSYVDLTFPELQRFFKSGLHIKTCYDLLEKYSSPDAIAALSQTKLTNLLKSSSRGRFGSEDAKALKSLAKASVGVKNTLLSIQTAQTIQQIQLLEQQKKELKAAITQLVKELNPVILTVPGIGPVNAAMILGEIGDIHRFEKPCKLLAYAGLDPTVKQSGRFQASHTRMSKRGSKLLRYALMNAAWEVSLNNKTFGDYFNLKLSQGHSHFNALGHVAHKLVRVIFKMMTANVAFNLP